MSKTTRPKIILGIIIIIILSIIQVSRGNFQKHLRLNLDLKLIIDIRFKTTLIQMIKSISILLQIQKVLPKQSLITT